MKMIAIGKERKKKRKKKDGWDIGLSLSHKRAAPLAEIMCKAQSLSPKIYPKSSKSNPLGHQKSN